MVFGKAALRTFVVLAALAAFSCSYAVPADNDELRRTWEGAWVYAPDATGAGYRRIGTAGLSGYLGSLRSMPPAVVLYAHGCDGLGYISAATGRLLARAGYLFVAPDSFARRNKPVSCIPARHLGSLHRAVLGWRQAELQYAFARINAVRALANVPLVLMAIPRARSPLRPSRACRRRAESSKAGRATPDGRSIADSMRRPASPC